MLAVLHRQVSFVVTVHANNQYFVITHLPIYSTFHLSVLCQSLVLPPLSLPYAPPETPRWGKNWQSHSNNVNHATQSASPDRPFNKYIMLNVFCQVFSLFPSNTCPVFSIWKKIYIQKDIQCALLCLWVPILKLFLDLKKKIIMLSIVCCYWQMITQAW